MKDNKQFYNRKLLVYFCSMKMRNDDVKKITEIKQYLLDPPVSFKLYDYAITYLRDAINILNNYPATIELTNYLQNLAEQFNSKQIAQAKVRSILKEAGVELSKLNSR